MERAADRGDGAPPEFRPVFVALSAEGLAFFEEDPARAAGALPIDSLALKGAGKAALLDDPPYNFEHTFLVRAPNADCAWWLCPDTLEQSEQWVAAINALA